MGQRGQRLEGQSVQSGPASWADLVQSTSSKLVRFRGPAGEPYCPAVEEVRGEQMRSWQHTVVLDPSRSEPLFLQLSEALQQDIRAGRLRPGMRLPGSRSLAEALGVHRNTVLAGYGELIAQGWLHTRPAGGTFVVRDLPPGSRQISTERMRARLSLAPGFPSRDEVLERYGRRSKRDLSKIDFYVAFSLWKSACIIEGVYARYLGGALGKTDVDLDSFKARIEAFAELADQAVARMG